MIVIGIDPHKQTHTAVAVAKATGQVLAELTVRARGPGFERLVAWAGHLGPSACSRSKSARTSRDTWSGT